MEPGSAARRGPRHWARAATPVAGALLLLVGVTGTGTVASYTASTDNDGGAEGAGNPFATGSLVLSDDLATADVCYSTGGALDHADCDAFFSLAGAAPGDATSATLVLRNEGSLDGTLQAYASGACTDAAAAGTAYHGASSLCAELALVVQEYADEASMNAGGAAGASGCVYGPDANADDVCEYDAAGHSVADFVAAHTDHAQPLSLGAMAASGASEVRYLRIGVELPSTAGNGVQGGNATFGITWRLVHQP